MMVVKLDRDSEAESKSLMSLLRKNNMNQVKGTIGDNGIKSILSPCSGIITKELSIEVKGMLAARSQTKEEEENGAGDTSKR